MVHRLGRSRLLRDGIRASDRGCSSAGLTPDARAALVDHDWPGNVRELHNALERAVILCDGELITAEHLPLHVSSVVAPRRQPRLSDVERRTIEQVLSEFDGNKSKAARRLGITRTQLYCRLRKYGLETAPSPGSASHAGEDPSGSRM
jgi:DNA-binding NtrC family response regulator